MLLSCASVPKTRNAIFNLATLVSHWGLNFLRSVDIKAADCVLVSAQSAALILTERQKCSLRLAVVKKKKFILAMTILAPCL